MMSKSIMWKSLVLLLIVGLIMVQAVRVTAATQDLQQIVSEDGSNSANALTNNSSGNKVNTNNNASVPTKVNTNNNSNKNKNTSLPKTGTNETIVIGLMAVCTITGLYALKKVKDYNM